MFNFCHVIVIILSIYHVSNARQLTRQCMADNGRCGSKKGSSCASVFGSGWKEKGKCCRNKPCCVFHCDDIQQDQLQNGQTVNITGTEVGATATFSCKAGYGFLGNQSIEKKCQETGWSGDGILTCVGCPETVVNFNGSTYKLNCGEFEFNQAEAFCKNQGGNLVTIETEEENNFLKNILTLMRNAGGASENLWWWIGLTDIKTDGSFEWVSGQSVTYTDWYQGPPPEPNGVAWNNAKADCVVMRHTYGFTWSDEYCRYYDVQAICELCHGVVSLVPIYEFDCPFGIFRPSFKGEVKDTKGIKLMSRI